MSGGRSERTTKQAPTRGQTLAASLRPIRLLVLEGPDRGRQAHLESGTAIVGSGEGCHLVLSDELVSRRHLSIELRAGHLRVTDQGSRNGTRYRGARVDAAEVPLGATIDLGETVLALVPADLPAGRLSERTELAGLVGRSLSMRRLYAEIELVAPTDTSVFLRGETGTGKEGVARALHELSARSSGPLHVFDCGAVHPTLVQASLFGHVRGAFTGAVADGRGALASADDGTLFLDEVAELPLDVQATFLRALDTRTYRRLGDNVTRRSDFRLVSATHQDLAEAVRRGRFRADLYHRLVVISLQLPPLRERPDDIPLLVEHFATTHPAASKMELPPEAIALMCAHEWPGNVRELKNTVERALTLGAEQALELSGKQGSRLDFHTARERAVKVFERAYLEAQLQRHVGNTTAAARDSNVARSYFYRLLATHGLRPRGKGSPGTS